MTGPLVFSILGIVAYDITRRCTFETASEWIKELQARAPGCRVVLVGSMDGVQVDQERERKVPTHEGEQLAEASGGLPFMEISARTGLNCTEAFRAAARGALGTLPGDVTWVARYVDCRRLSCQGRHMLACL